MTSPYNRDMAKEITQRLEEMSDLLLVNHATQWVAASLLLWEAAQHIRAQREAIPDESRIYVSALSGDPDE